MPKPKITGHRTSARRTTLAELEESLTLRYAELDEERAALRNLLERCEKVNAIQQARAAELDKRDAALTDAHQAHGRDLDELRELRNRINRHAGEVPVVETTLQTLERLEHDHRTFLTFAQEVYEARRPGEDSFPDTVARLIEDGHQLAAANRVGMEILNRLEAICGILRSNMRDPVTGLRIRFVRSFDPIPPFAVGAQAARPASFDEPGARENSSGGLAEFLSKFGFMPGFPPQSSGNMTIAP